MERAVIVWQYSNGITYHKVYAIGGTVLTQDTASKCVMDKPIQLPTPPPPPGWPGLRSERRHAMCRVM